MTEADRRPGPEAELPGDWGESREEHRRRQLASFLKATPAQRLAWLEEMIELAHRSGALPKRRA